MYVVVGDAVVVCAVVAGAIVVVAVVAIVEVGVAVAAVVGVVVALGVVNVIVVAAPAAVAAYCCCCCISQVRPHAGRQAGRTIVLGIVGPTLVSLHIHIMRLNDWILVLCIPNGL